MIGDLHIHSKYSLDSVMNPKKILEIAKSKGFDTVAITDHNTIRGAIEAKKFEDIIGIRVIVGSEIRTDIGDLIGLKLEREIGERSWDRVLSEIKDQGGIAVLPHPYRDHTMVKEVAKKVDLIEIWNARCHPEQNNKALELATSVRCGTIMGSDAHLYSEIGNLRVKSNPMTLATEEVLEREYAISRQIRWSQVVGYTRKGDIVNLLSLGGKYLWKKITY